MNSKFIFSYPLICPAYHSSKFCSILKIKIRSAFNRPWQLQRYVIMRWIYLFQILSLNSLSSYIMPWQSVQREKNAAQIRNICLRLWHIILSHVDVFHVFSLCEVYFICCDSFLNCHVKCDITVHLLYMKEMLF